MMLRSLGTAFVLTLGGIACAPPEDERDRITATLDGDGYALFALDPRGADRAAVVVEMRDAPAGTCVLLHSQRPPAASGWFSLDVDAYSPCRRYGKDAVDQIELDCLVPSYLSWHSSQSALHAVWQGLGEVLHSGFA
jgi:hypothetical protein